MSKYGWDGHKNIGVLLGKTLVDVEVNEDLDEIKFTTDEGEVFVMYHSQDCCESVSIEDIAGDLLDLIGSPIVTAEERDNGDAPAKDEWDESYTWTFYELATVKGSVTIRWYGSSNGYYSESVDFQQIEPKQED